MPQLIGLVVILGLVGLIVGLVLAAVYIFVVYILPFLVLGGALLWYLRHPYRPLRDRYAALAARVTTLSIPSSDIFLQGFAERFIGALKETGQPPPSDEMCVVLLEAVGTLYQEEDFPTRFALPVAPEWQWRLRPDYYRLKVRLAEIETALDQYPSATAEFSEVCAHALTLFTAALPAAARQTWKEFHESDDSSEAALTVPACELMHDVPNLVGHLAGLFAASVTRSAGVFEQFIASYDRAVVAVSSKELTQSQLKEGQYVSPEAYEGTSAELVRAYFFETALYEPFTTPIPFSFGEARFQHEWIVDPTGSGKTQLLKTQIASDLSSVGRGEASIVVMDSQGAKPGTLVGDLVRLKAFAPGGELEGRLVFLAPIQPFRLPSTYSISAPTRSANYRSESGDPISPAPPT